MQHNSLPTTSAESQQDTPASRLGVVDGAFAVERTNKEIDRGWGVVNDASKTHLRNGELVPAVVLAKPHETDPNKYHTKVIPVEEFMQWQADDAEAQKVHEIALVEAVQDMGDTAVSQVIEAQEALDPREARDKLLFAPVAAAEAPKVTDYGYLFAPEEEFQKIQQQMSVENAANRSKQNSREHVTEQNRSAAVYKIVSSAQRNPKVAEMLKAATQGANIDTIETVDLIRTNPELRLALGKYFLDKTNQIAHSLPERVRKNGHKNPNHVGYEGLNPRSREYVAILCLSMLDGSFDSDSVSSTDSIDTNADGEVVLGQHRSAAMDVLFS